MKAAASLKIDQLSVRYRQHTVLHELSLPAIEPGQLVALTGPNGAGKSTLLKALAGLVPAQGRVSFGEMDWLHSSIRTRASMLGFMPQNLPDDHDLSVLEATLTALHNLDLASRRARERKALETLALLGIEELALHPLARLSGGQKQLAALAQAVVRDSSILLLDEPVSALDLAHQWQVMHITRTLADAGRIVLVVLHDLALSAQWADRVGILQAGQLHSYGPPADVITATALREVWSVRAQVETLEPGRLQIWVDGPVATGT